MAIKTTEIRDKVQILKGTVQKQMILRNVFARNNEMPFVIDDHESEDRLPASRLVQPLVSSDRGESIV